ncbi:MAG TPA: 3-deoxy-D-manno-octulosonic acid transferase [Terracidiphilus sp.]|jgi:3-deoxy-D-manno-octulosonic-acid transferase|nr:3-deoxy-D-manno-octulosonic acid transferase [Terracidiphilus sp.]
MTLFLYNLALVTILTATAPWWLWKIARTRRYREGLKARLGEVPASLAKLRAHNKTPVIWLHAVSVGEVLAMSRLVSEMDWMLPGYRLLISTTTRTGQELARERFGPNRVFYCPLDLPWAVKAYLDTLSPRLLVLAESEFWPNMLHNCYRRKIPVMVVNARISDRSWPRYQLLHRLWKPLLGPLSAVLAQSGIDGERLLKLGCVPERLTVSGNLKFDVRTAEESDATLLLRNMAGSLRLIVAGSTLEGEEAALLDAWPRLLTADPQLVLILAPRHPERFGEAADLLERSGIPWVRRSDWPAKPAYALDPLVPGSAVLLDSIGELASVYSLATVAFIGGSIVPSGGHNPLEPAQFAVPVVMGPHYANFRAITDDLRAHHAIRIAAKEELAAALIEMIQNPEQADAIGVRAAEVFERQAGATERCMAAMRAVLAETAQ